MAEESPRLEQDVWNGSSSSSSGPSGEDYDAGLEALRREEMCRSVRTLSIASPAHFVMDSGRDVVSFCLNDYLGLRHHPWLIAAVSDAVAAHGAGAGASMVAGGHRPVHRELEEALAEFKGTQDCRITSSGYTAALSIIQALVQLPDGRKRPVIFDRLSHACMLDGIRLHGPRHGCHSFRHNDVGDLERQLMRLDAQSGQAKALVVVEGLYSMDGDEPPLADIVTICEKYGAWLLIDDAHATGVFGQGGRGSLSRAGVDRVSDRPIVVMGTLSKALASQGGFVAGPRSVLRWMENISRAYLFDTGLAPPCAAAALAALRILQNEPNLPNNLLEKSGNFREKLRQIVQQANCDSAYVPECTGPIIPLILGYVSSTVRLARDLESIGLLVSAIRPPTVKPGTSRLRIALSLHHGAIELDRLLGGLRELLSREPQT